MQETVTGSGVDAGRAGTDTAPPGSGSAVLRFVERYGRASGTSPSATTPADGSGPRRCAGDRLDPVELERLREAGRRALERYPGPVGDLVARDLAAVAEFGFRLARGTFYRRLVDHLLDPRTSGDPAAVPDDEAATARTAGGVAVMPRPGLDRAERRRRRAR